MAMAGFVLVLIISRFNSFMKERGDRIHHIEMRRFSVAHAAFMLGISNMRRRKLRTGLTLTTLVLLDVYGAFLCLVREPGAFYLATP